MNFSELGLNKDLLKGINAAGFNHCTPVQEATLAKTLEKRDVCVQSQTGTGKTAAFLISIFQLLLKDEDIINKKILIIAPTRELAVQIEKDARLLGKYLKFSIGCFYGGVGYSEQEKILSNGIDIIVGTPGRLIDFNEQEKIKFREVGILVIDEADRLFDMGFFPDITRMIKDMPPQSERITMLFSATLNTRVRNLAWKYMNNPVEIEISPENIVVENITQEIFHVGKDEKFKLLLGILNKEKPKNAIIFTNMKRTAQEVYKRLEYNGIKCQFIMGDLPQSKRLKIIEKVKSGKIQILVATEVAARGLHIDDLDLVINYDLPEDCENYVHRIGRTARAGKSGKAISLACEKYVYSLEAIESLTKYKIPVSWADDDLFIEDKSAGIHLQLDKFTKTGIDKRSRNRKGPLHRKKRHMVYDPSIRTKPKVKYYSDIKKSIKAFNTVPNKNNSIINPHIKYKDFDYNIKPMTGQIPAMFKKRFFNKILSLLNIKISEKYKNHDKKNKIKASKNGTIQERMEYYRKKYGIKFIPGKELLARENKKK